MSGTADTNFSLGDQYWCVLPFLDIPLLGTIIALTDAPGKTIGLQFEQEVPKGHTCDGRGEPGRCLWNIPAVIYNATEWETVGQIQTQTQTLEAHAALAGKSFKSITVDADDRVITDESEDGGQPGIQKLEDGKMPAIRE